MAFLTTIWGQIDEARKRGGGAMEELVRRYWEPVRTYLERKGFGSEAEDIAQEVMMEVCRKDFLRKADASKGRFRTLIYKVTRNIAGKHLRSKGTEKRGGMTTIVPLDGDPPDENDQSEYSRLWAMHTLRTAINHLKKEKLEYGEAIELHFIEGIPCKEIARMKGRTDQDVRNWIFQGKKKLRTYLAEGIRDYCSSPEEYREEIAELGKYLP